MTDSAAASRPGASAFSVAVSASVLDGNCDASFRSAGGGVIGKTLAAALGCGETELGRWIDAGYLPRPRAAVNPHYRCGSPMRLYDAALMATTDKEIARWRAAGRKGRTYPRDAFLMARGRVAGLEAGAGTRYRHVVFKVTCMSAPVAWAIHAYAPANAGMVSIDDEPRHAVSALRQIAEVFADQRDPRTPGCPTAPFPMSSSLSPRPVSRSSRRGRRR